MPENSITARDVAAIDNLLNSIFGGDLFLGICDECRQARNFRTEREAELWKKFHPHELGDEESA